jgi:hypothetical protein
MPISYEMASSLLHSILDAMEFELTCDEFVMRSSLFATLEVPVGKRHALAASGVFAHHLSICAECREEFESLKQVLRSMPV